MRRFADFCDDPSTLDVTIAIGRPSMLDANGNGSLDACECATDVTGPDGVSDGWVDQLDLEQLLSEWGSPCGGACTTDATGPQGPDGNVDALDLLVMLGEWGGPGCE